MFKFTKGGEAHVIGDLLKEVEKVAKVVLWSTLTSKTHVHAKYRRKSFIPISESPQGICIPYIFPLCIQRA